MVFDWKITGFECGFEFVLSPPDIVSKHEEIPLRDNVNKARSIKISLNTKYHVPVHVIVLHPVVHQKDTLLLAWAPFSLRTYWNKFVHVSEFK